MKIAIISTIPFAVNVFLKQQIKALSKDYKVTIIVNGYKDDLEELLCDNVKIYTLNIKRNISIFNDIKAFIKLIFYLWKEKYDVAYSIMPKSGLLGMVASKIAGVKYRIHVFTGQIWANKSGIKRLIFKYFDKLILYCTTHSFADGFSQAKYLHDEGVDKGNKIKVLGCGSICGVDIKKFMPDKSVYKRVRSELGIREKDIVVLYVGRLTEEKGLKDLIDGFKIAYDKNKNLKLICVGPNEGEISNYIKILENDSFFIFGYTSEPEKFMKASDIFVLVSHREGFGSVIIESAACGIASICSDIYGLRDSVIDNKTGIVTAVKNPYELSEKILLLSDNGNLRKELGENARNRVIKYFSTDYIIQKNLDFFSTLKSGIK